MQIFSPSLSPPVLFTSYYFNIFERKMLEILSTLLPFGSAITIVRVNANYIVQRPSPRRS